MRVLRLTAGTIYKILFVGLVFSMLPLSVLFGIMAFFGANTITWNGQNIYGFWGLISGIAVGAFLSMAFAVILGSCCFVGLWLYSRFESIGVAFIPLADTENTDQAQAINNPGAASQESPPK